MDIYALMTERKRIADDLRSTLTCLGILRASLIGSPTEEARQHLLSTIEGEMSAARELGDRLLKLDASIQQLRQREKALCPSPLLSAPLDF
jgi:hypothetical protein